MTEFTPQQADYLRQRAAFPAWLIVESTNRCNANCVICPHGEMTRPAGTMAMALFRKITDEAASYRDQIEKFALFNSCREISGLNIVSK